MWFSPRPRAKGDLALALAKRATVGVAELADAGWWQLTLPRSWLLAIGQREGQPQAWQRLCCRLEPVIQRPRAWFKVRNTRPGQRLWLSNLPRD